MDEVEEEREEEEEKDEQQVEEEEEGRRKQDQEEQEEDHEEQEEEQDSTSSSSSCFLLLLLLLLIFLLRRGRRREAEEHAFPDMAIIFFPKHCAKHDHFYTPITHMLNESSIRSEQGLGAENYARQIQRSGEGEEDGNESDPLLDINPGITFVQGGALPGLQPLDLLARPVLSR